MENEKQFTPESLKELIRKALQEKLEIDSICGRNVRITTDCDSDVAVMILGKGKNEEFVGKIRDVVKEAIEGKSVDMKDEDWSFNNNFAFNLTIQAT